MMEKYKQIVSDALPFFGRFFSGEKMPDIPQKKNRRSVETLDIEKQKKLDALCQQLLCKKELIMSGKLQFIGLTKIRKRLGKEWAGLSRIVYNTVEEILANHLDKSDVFLRYNDEAYILLFARASKEEANTKATLIAEDIRKRLFELDEKALRDLEIRQAISEIRRSSLKDGSFSDFLDSFAMNDAAQEKNPEVEPENHLWREEIQSVEVDAAYYKPKSALAVTESILPTDLHYAYMPLWDVRRNALTTYLCFLRSAGKNTFDSFKGIYDGQTAGTKLALDVKMLEFVRNELESMEKDGRQLLIACPVQHETLYRFESYETYKELLQDIPAEHRQYLIFLVTGTAEEISLKDPYWFAAPLRAYCRHVFAEVPLRRDINFNYLTNSGVDVVGIQLNRSTVPEQEIISILNGFGAKAKAFKIPQTFVLGVSSLSLTTSAVCAGFSYLGGTAIHGDVAKPDIIHRYKNEDLLSNLIQSV